VLNYIRFLIFSYVRYSFPDHPRSQLLPLLQVNLVLNIDNQNQTEYTEMFSVPCVLMHCLSLQQILSVTDHSIIFPILFSYIVAYNDPVTKKYTQIPLIFY